MRLLPDGYTQLECIESSGTQYIDTGFKPNQDTRVVIDFENFGTTTAGILGSRTAYLSTDYTFWAYSATAFLSNYYTQAKQIPIDTVLGRYTADKNKNVTTIGGATSTATSGVFECPYNLYLFTINQKGTAESRMGTIKLYLCRIYDNGVLVRNYLPCKNASGEVGLYDLVNGVFYGNAGTGAFIAGAIIPEEPEVPPRKVTVDLTPPMTGEKTEEFNINYYVIDDIGTESFAVVEYIDGEETQSRTVTAGETISTLIESTGMDDGSHTFMLIVDETVEVEYTFYVNNSTTTIKSTGVAIDLPAEVNINEKFLISVIVTEISFTIAKLKIHAGDIYSGEV